MSDTRARVLEADLDGVEESIRTRIMVFRLLLSLGGQLRTLMDRRLAPMGITTQQAAFLMIAGASTTPLAQGEIARLLGVSHQNVRQLATALEKKGLLFVETDPKDRRTKRMRPAKAAATLFTRRNAADYEAVARWFGMLNDRDAGKLLQLLGRVGRELPARAARTS